MPFTAAITETTVEGSQLVKRGTYTSTGGSTGGDITTNLNQVNSFRLQPGGAAALALAPVVNETFPLINTGGAVTVVTNANETGFWEAKGY